MLGRCPDIGFAAKGLLGTVVPGGRYSGGGCALEIPKKVNRLE